MRPARQDSTRIDSEIRQIDERIRNLELMRIEREQRQAVLFGELSRYTHFQPMIADYVPTIQQQPLLAQQAQQTTHDAATVEERIRNLELMRIERERRQAILFEQLNQYTHPEQTRIHDAPQHHYQLLTEELSQPSSPTTDARTTRFQSLQQADSATHTQAGSDIESTSTIQDIDNPQTAPLAIMSSRSNSLISTLQFDADQLLLQEPIQQPPSTTYARTSELDEPLLQEDVDTMSAALQEDTGYEERRPALPITFSSRSSSPASSTLQPDDDTDDRYHGYTQQDITDYEYLISFQPTVVDELMTYHINQQLYYIRVDDNGNCFYDAIATALNVEQPTLEPPYTQESLRELVSRQIYQQIEADQGYRIVILGSAIQFKKDKLGQELQSETDLIQQQMSSFSEQQLVNAFDRVNRIQEELEALDTLDEVTSIDHSESSAIIDEYVTYMCSTGSWADDITIAALSNCVNSPIAIIQQDENGNITLNVHGERSEHAPIFVHYNGTNHYDALIPKLGCNPQDLLTELEEQLLPARGARRRSNSL